MSPETNGNIDDNKSNAVDALAEQVSQAIHKAAEPKGPDPMEIVGDELESFRNALDREANAARALGESRANFLLAEVRFMGEIKDAINERETLVKAIAKRKKVDIKSMILDMSQMRFVPRQ